MSHSSEHTIPSESTPLLTHNTPEHVPSLDSESCIPMIWEELPILTRYALPVCGTQLLEYTLILASVVSIGHVSTNALAAVSLGSMTATVSGFSIIHGLASALDTLMPSAWTSSQPKLVGLWAQRMCKVHIHLFSISAVDNLRSVLVMTASLIPMFIIWFNAEAILLALKQDPEVAHLAGVYLRWMTLGLPAYAFNTISRRYFQSQNLFSIPTRIIVVVAPFNAFLNYLLVWGPVPVRLGFIGAPIANAISFNLFSLLSILYGAFFVPKTAWHPISRKMFTSLGVLVNLGASGIGQVASEWWAWELAALGASLLGPAALATQSVLLVSSSTTYQIPYAFGVATSVRIGNLLGQQNAKRAAATAITAMFMALSFATLTCTMFIVFRTSWAYLFNDDPEVARMVAAILPLVALFQVFDGACAVANGILRAQGKQFAGALLNVVTYYVVGIPIGMVLAFKYNMGLHGLWAGLTLGLVACALIVGWISLSADWNDEVKKVQERLAKEKKRLDDARTIHDDQV